MRGGLKINTVSAEGGGYEVEQEGTVAPWLKQFAKALNKQDTIVQQARRRNQAAGYLDHVQNILINRPRYATVEDAVKDFRKRTGLDSYLDEIKQSKKAPDKITKKASVASRMKTLAQMGLKKKVATDQIPGSLAQYPEAAEDIAAYVKNRIEDLHALGVSIPQLQQGILETFSVRHGIQDKDIYNADVEKWLSDKIEAAQHLTPPEVSTPQIGAGVTKEDSQEDSDAFSGLMPASQY